MPPRSPLQPEASLPQLPGALAADSSSLSLCLGSVLGCVWSVRGTEAWLHASMRDNPEGHPGSRFLVRWAEVLVVRAAAPPCAGSASSLPHKHCPRECSPEPSACAADLQLKSLFPRKPYTSKTGCVYVHVFLNRNKIHTYVLSNKVLE